MSGATLSCAGGWGDSQAHEVSTRKDLGEKRVLEMSETAPLTKTPSVGGYFVVLHHHLYLLAEVFFFCFFFLKEISDLYLCSDDTEGSSV